MRRLAAISAALFLVGCSDGQEVDRSSDAVVRSVRTTVVSVETPERIRRFPAVLEPPEITQLSFDAAGRLGPLNLRIGQQVVEGEVLAEIEAIDASLRLQQAEAAVLEAQAAFRNATADANRQRALAERDVVSEAARDRAVTTEEQAAARLQQAKKNLQLLSESLSDTALRAPFSGILNSIETRAFATVSAGQPIVTLYPDGALQATILVSYDVVSKLALGQSVDVVPADGSDMPLSATVREIAQRAPSVSSFPVVVALNDERPDLRSGMAVEVVASLPVADAAEGLPIPLSALALQRPANLSAMPRQADVFVYQDGVVEARAVRLNAFVEDRAYVADGLVPGERIVTAGATFLHSGQRVRLEERARPQEARR